MWWNKPTRRSYPGVWSFVLLGTIVLTIGILLRTPLAVRQFFYNTFGGLKFSSQHLKSPALIDVKRPFVGDVHTSTWNIPPLEQVAMTIENSNHYSLNEDLGQWSSLLPKGNGVVYLDSPGQGRQPFTISLFHQLRCLDIIRDGLVLFRQSSSRGAKFQPDSERIYPSRLVQHCMDYLRQMVLCRSNTELQSVRNHTGTRVTVSDITQICEDWTAVFAEAERQVEGGDVSETDFEKK